MARPSFHTPGRVEQGGNRLEPPASLRYAVGRSQVTRKLTASGAGATAAGSQPGESQSVLGKRRVSRRGGDTQPRSKE